jgi:hypothetical protein
LLGNGDPQIFAVPIGIDDGRWLVVRRVAAGSAIADPAEPFQIEQFDGMSDGAAHFCTIARDAKPVLLTTPDGRVLVISLKASIATRRRAGGIEPPPLLVRRGDQMRNDQ